MADDLRPLYDKIDALQGQVSHLSGEMRANMATISATLAERCVTRGEKLTELAEDHEATKCRVTILEQDKAKVIGGSIVAGGLVGGAVTLFFKIISMGEK